MQKILILCTTDSMIWNFLIPHIEAMKKKKYSIECAASKTGIYFDELKYKYGIKIFEIPFTRTPISISNIKSFYLLNKLIKKQKYDIIFCHEPVGGMMGRIVGKLNKKKVIYMAHGFHFFKGAPLKHWLIYYPAEYIFSFLTDVLITINTEDYSCAKKMYAKKNYYIHGIGIQKKINNSFINCDDLKRKLGLKNDIILLTVGELSARKNHKIILEAMRILKKNNVKLIICGDGELKIFLQRKIKEYDLEDRVLLPGFVKNVGDYIAISDIFVFPSLWEGLSIACLEAMKKKMVIIGSNRRGIKDYVINMKTGLTFEPNNANELAEKIELVIKNKTLTNQLILNSSIEIEKYEIDNVKKELEQIYIKEIDSYNRG